jgi:hypothetical protein
VEWLCVKYFTGGLREVEGRGCGELMGGGN